MPCLQRSSTLLSLARECLLKILGQPLTWRLGLAFTHHTRPRVLSVSAHKQERGLINTISKDPTTLGASPLSRAPTVTGFQSHTGLTRMSKYTIQPLSILHKSSLPTKTTSSQPNKENFCLTRTTTQVPNRVEEEEKTACLRI
mgnify:CR=1 FL=1